MYVCMYVCMYVHRRSTATNKTLVYVCMHSMYVCMYVCIIAFLFHLYVYIFHSLCVS